MNKILKLIFFLVSMNGFSQSLHHQMISAQGGNSIAPSGLIVKYTIGQQSVTGNTTGANIVQQGFQQNNWNKIIKKNKVSIRTTTFPNPFFDRINFTFSGSVGDTVSLHIYDVSGRLVLKDNLQVVDQTASIDLKHLPSANYFIQLSNSNYLHYTTAIKN